jgi:hypothetical protein
MRWVQVMGVVALVGVGLVAAQEQVRSLRFRKDDLGKVPAGWKVDKTGTGQGSVWKVVADATAPSKTGVALAQTAEGPLPLFNLCVADDTSYTDVEVSVAFKAVRGELDQGGGIVWRYQDNNHYYVARMNPLENNYRLYKVEAGKRVQLASQAGLKVPAGEWHTLRIRMTGDHIECYLDDRKLLDARDATIKAAGKVGLWTKADAQSHFDDFKISGK